MEAEKNNGCKRKKDDDETVTEPAVQEQPSKKKSKKEVAVFGNYRNYYGYRVIFSSFSDFTFVLTFNYVYQCEN